MSPYGKNRNEFVVRTDNNPLTYIFSSTNLDAAGQRWVAQLASYNFSLEYQKGKDNTVADFLSRLDKRLPKEEVQDYLDKIPYPGVKAVLDNAITPLEERAELGVRPDPESRNANQEEAVAARAARLASTNIIDWKVEQKDDPVLYEVVKHLRASREVFKEALLTVLDKKAVTAYVKAKGAIAPQERPPVSQDPDRACQGDHLSVCGASKTLQCGNGWLPPGGGTPRPTSLHLSDAGAILVARYGSGPPQPHQEMWPLLQIRSSSSDCTYAAFNLQWARGATAC